MGFTTKTIDELDLLDDFLTNAVAGNKEVGERCFHRILSVLLQRELGEVRVISQRILPAPMPELRGIRMDVEIEELGQSGSLTSVYDLEPHRQRDINLPRHNRFYQAKIDSRYMKRGEKDFSNLPNLYVITITNFDPFGYDYMMYTVQNKCVEVEQMEYEDGLQFIYFNTRGQKGGSRAIRSMLTYIQSSKEENAVDEATREVHSCVERIRHLEEVRDGYMTFGDLIDMEREEAAQEATQETALKTRAETIIELLEELGQVSETLRKRITEETSIETLKAWFKLAAKAESIAEFESKLEESIAI